MCFASFGIPSAGPVTPSPTEWDLADSIRAATSRLSHEAQPPRVGAPPREGLLVITRAPEATCPVGSLCHAASECRAAKTAADEAVAQGIELSVACAGGGCSTSCLADLPVAGSYYTLAEWPSALRRQEAIARSSELAVTRVELLEIAAPGIEPDAQTFDPADATYDPSTRAISWSTGLLPGGADASFAYGAVPTRPGRSHVADGAGTLTDSLGRTRRFVVPPRQVSAALRLTRLSLPTLFAHEARVHP
jgi:hypothetical protein